ncbi:hypothetical protein LINPERHAP1_LOCUS26424 [Linum perenne]
MATSMLTSMVSSWVMAFWTILFKPAMSSLFPLLFRAAISLPISTMASKELSLGLRTRSLGPLSTRL